MLSRLLMRFCYNDSRVRQDYDKCLAFLKYMLACGKFDMDPQYLSMVSFRCPYPAVLAAAAAHAPMPDDMRARSFLRSVLQRRMPKSVIKPLLERGIVPPEGAQLFMLLRANNFADVIELFRGKLPDSQINELLKDADKRDSDSVAGQGMFSPGNPNRAR